MARVTCSEIIQEVGHKNENNSSNKGCKRKENKKKIKSMSRCRDYSREEYFREVGWKRNRQEIKM